MARLVTIEGIGQVYGEKLKAAGVPNTDKLLEACKTPKGRADLAGRTGIDAKVLLEWANRADLMRIKGVGEEYSDLLEQSGVDTVAELAQRSGQSLYEKLQSVNLEKKLVRMMPTLAQVLNWVEQAKKLPRAINY